MSHSQFHCIKSFILRHAWLNLWDKHMTTGRINQVTILKNLRTCSQAQKKIEFVTSTSRKKQKDSPDLPIDQLISYWSLKQVSRSQIFSQPIGFAMGFNSRFHRHWIQRHVTAQSLQSASLVRAYKLDTHLSVASRKSVSQVSDFIATFSSINSHFISLARR